MKILLLFSSSELGGAERSLSRMAMASSPKEVDYQLATLGGEGPWSEWIRSENHSPIIFGGRFTLFAICRLIKYVRKTKTDAIYVCGSRVSLYLRLLKFLIPKSVLVHGVRWNPNSSSGLDRFFRIVEKLTHPLVDAWITNSAIAKTTLVTKCGIPPSKIHVIYNGLESFPNNVPALNDRPMKILTVANISPRKGYIEYLEVVREVTSVIPGAQFIFVGRDDMNGKLASAVTELKLQDNVTCEGFLKDVTDLYSRSRIFVLPSLWNEGCPTAILEAMSYSIPCIAFSIDGIPELVEDDRQGLLCERGNYSKMSAAILDLLTDTEKSKMLGEEGLKRVKNHFSLGETTKKHIQVFENVLKRKPNNE